MFEPFMRKPKLVFVGSIFAFDIVPQLSIYRSIIHIYTSKYIYTSFDNIYPVYTSTRKIFGDYFDHSFDNKIDDNDTIKRAKAERLPGG